MRDGPSKRGPCGQGSSRREFLGGGAAMLTAAGTGGRSLFGGTGPAGNDRTLVAIEIAGGWDYLSMLIPTEHPVYQRERPNLRIPRSATLAVDSTWDWRWHPALAPLKVLFDRGDLAIIENVGHAGPDLSHFSSIKKWQSGDISGAPFMDGWLGRYLTRTFGPGYGPGLDIEPYPSAVFAGAKVPALLDIGTLALNFDWSSSEDSAVGRLAIETNALVAELLTSGHTQAIAERTVQAHRYAEYLRNLGSSYQPRASYPGTELAGNLQLAAKLVSAAAPIRAMHLRTSGFDTHSLQAEAWDPARGELATRLGDLATAVRAFLDDVRAWGRGANVVVMLYSEFGRRVTENGALGTDHGHGGVAFLAGEPVHGGRYGQTPDLTAIQRPGESFYLPFDARSTDFRRIYATVLENWLQVPSAPILNGTFAPLGAL